METMKNKVYVHFNTNDVQIYEMKKSTPFLLKKSNCFLTKH